MYRSILDRSQKMNFTIWPFDDSPNTYAYPSYEENYQYAYDFLKTRHNSIMPLIAKWDVPSYDTVCDCMNGNHIDANTDGKCDICKTEVPLPKLTLWEKIINFLRMIIEFIKNIFK